MAITNSSSDNPWGVREHGNTAISTTAIQNISIGPTYLTGINISSANADPTFLKFWNTTSAVTVGTTAPNLIVPIPASWVGFVAVEAYNSDGDKLKGLYFSNGLTYAATEDAGTAGTTAPGSSVYVDLRIED